MQDSLALYNQLMQVARDEAREELQAEFMQLMGKAKGKAKRAAKPVKARAKPAKRTAVDIEALTASLKRYVAKNPGQKLEEIAAGLGVETAQLKGPVKKLVEEKVFSRKGVARGSRYTAKA